MVYVQICPYQAKNTICAVIMCISPPSMDLDKFISGLEREFLERLSDEVEKDLVLMGDFNTNVISPKPCKYTRKLLQTTRHGFTQVINGPTCMTEQYIHCYRFAFCQQPTSFCFARSSRIRSKRSLRCFCH